MCAVFNVGFRNGCQVRLDHHLTPSSPQLPSDYITVTAQDTFGITDGNQVGTVTHMDHVLADHLKGPSGSTRLKRLLGEEYARDQDEIPWSYIEAQVHMDMRSGRTRSSSGPKI
jgi:hypothetical protein